MSVARVDGTAARPLDWAPRDRQPAKARRQSSAPAPAPQRPAGDRASARRLTAGQILLFAACWLAIVAGAVAVVARHAEIASAGYRITAAQNELAKIQHENMLLEAEVALLADPERIYRIATEQLGMVSRERFEVTVVATAEPVERPTLQGATIASLGADAAELAGTEGFWAGLGRTVIGWLTGQPQQAAAKAPER